MPIARSQLKQPPIDETDVIKNRVMTFGNGRLTVVEVKTADDYVGVGQCRMSDQDLANPRFVPDKNHAKRTARWRALESVRRQRKGKEIHDPLMR